MQLVLKFKLNNKQWMGQQIQCLLDRGPCDNNGLTAKRYGAAGALTGHCPSPCDKCTRQMIGQVVYKLQSDYPAQYFLIQNKLRF